MDRQKLLPILQALGAAALFGASAPLAKVIVGYVEPVPLAAFLYLGSGLGLLLFLMLRSARTPAVEAEAPLSRRDFPWLVGAVLAGGVVAPIVLMSSLRATPAATASILLNFESVATAVMAALVFHEAIGRRAWLGLAAIAFSSIVLSFDVRGEFGISLGALGVLAACVLWGVDNNLTHHISAKDPVVIGTIKGLGAGTFSLLLALAVRQPLPGIWTAVAAMLLGSVSYGLSVVLFISAMRGMGASRTSALFGTAPFVGVLLSLLLFRETPGAVFLLALPIMVLGVFTLLREEHVHEHTHAAIEHEHRHGHEDGHHDPAHTTGGLAVLGRHSHWHVHVETTHTHGHTPDTHHRHQHSD